MILWGDNDCGKTSAAAVVAKEARRRGFSVLFVRAAQYRDAVMNKEMYNESMTVKQRCENVDLLLLDDFAKESTSGKSEGGSERMFEDLLRERTSHRRSTIITMNPDPAKLDVRYKQSMQKLVSEAFAVVKLIGPSQRAVEQQELIKFFKE